MLFNSIEFIFFLLPLSILSFFLARKFTQLKFAIYTLIFFSFIFYGFWNPINIFLLISSITFNYQLAKIIRKNKQKYLLVFGVTINLLILFYFKYTNFVLNNLNVLLNKEWEISKIALPLAISFFTFQQIAYIVDNYNKKIVKHCFREYILFISFFPQLISGPIVMHEKLIPQIQDKKFGKFDIYLISMGFSLFVIGLVKKIFIADNLAYYANNLFDSASIGNKVQFFEGWIGSICFYFQIYFDFSGYTDMASGIALMFGIKLPLNFNSPYKSTSVIEFWRRWHITLSDFIKNYLYIPLVSIFTSHTKNYLVRDRIQKFPFIFIPLIFPIIITFALSGLWHGAATTFIIWGLYHGVLVSINHVYKFLIYKYKFLKQENKVYNFCSFILTFLSVNVGWVFFRSNDLATAISIFKGMFGFNKIILSSRLKEYLFFLNDNNSIFYFASENQSWLGFIRLEALLFIIASSIICFSFSSSMSLFSFVDNDNGKKFTPSILTGFITGIIFVILIVFIISKSTSEFLYYQF